MSITEEMKARLLWLENDGAGDCDEANQIRDVLNGTVAEPRYPTEQMFIYVYLDDSRLKRDVINRLEAIPNTRVLGSTSSHTRIEVSGIPDIVANVEGVSIISWKELSLS